MKELGRCSKVGSLRNNAQPVKIARTFCNTQVRVHYLDHSSFWAFLLLICHQVGSLEVSGGANDGGRGGWCWIGFIPVRGFFVYVT